MVPRFSSPVESRAEVGSRSVALHTFPNAITNLAFCGSTVGYAFAEMMEGSVQRKNESSPTYLIDLVHKFRLILWCQSPNLWQQGLATGGGRKLPSIVMCFRYMEPLGWGGWLILGIHEIAAFTARCRRRPGGRSLPYMPSWNASGLRKFSCAGQRDSILMARGHGRSLRVSNLSGRGAGRPSIPPDIITLS
jgi:hypothetical protein